MIVESRKIALEDFAAALADSWKTGVPVTLPDANTRPINRAEAYFVQDHMASLIGEPVTGWKAGATSENMRARDGHDDIVPGRTFASKTFEGSNHQLDFDAFADARLEPEFAYRIHRDLPPRSAPWTAAELKPLVTAHIAIEIIANRYPSEASGINTCMTIADNGGGRGIVIGTAIKDPEAVDYHHHAIAFSVNGEPPAPTSPPHIRCSPIDALADLVNNLSARKISLTEGAFLTTGSATDTLPVKAGSRAVADFGELGNIVIEFSSTDRGIEARAVSRSEPAQ